MKIIENKIRVSTGALVTVFRPEHNAEPYAGLVADKAPKSVVVHCQDHGFVQVAGKPAEGIRLASAAWEWCDGCREARQAWDARKGREKTAKASSARAELRAAQRAREGKPPIPKKPRLGPKWQSEQELKLKAERAKRADDSSR